MAEAAVDGAAAAEQLADVKDLSNEQLQAIKARTMYQMVEELRMGAGKKKKMLFLTNMQAELIASRPTSIGLMLEAFDVPKPKLVINLLTSQGFADYVLSGDIIPEFDSGCIANEAPFLSFEAERDAEAAIDRFMLDTLIPLAASTNAIVICSASPQACVLSTSFTRMFAVCQAQWGHHGAPFSVLSCLGNIHCMYRNRDQSAHWRSVLQASSTWRQRHSYIEQLCERNHAEEDLLTGKAYSHDLDPNASMYLIVDLIDEVSGTFGVDKTGYNHLVSALVRHLSATLPSLTIKTGHVSKHSILNAHMSQSSLAQAESVALSGGPVVFLDVRPRKPLVGADRAALLQSFKDQHEATCEELLNAGRPETLDCCSIAHLHHALFGEHYSNKAAKTAKMSRGEGNSSSEPRGEAAGAHDALVPLWAALRRAREESASGVENLDLLAHEAASESYSGLIPKASSRLVADATDWLTERTFRDCWQVRTEALQERSESYQVHWKEAMLAHSVFARTLLGSPNFNSLNIADGEGATTEATRLLSRLVKGDRLPKRAPLEGLLLMRSAWREHDVAMHLADWYKLLSKAIFAVQLLVAWLVVVGSVVSEQQRDTREDLSSVLVEVVFALSVVLSLLYGVESAVNAKARWRQLRSCAGSLHSVLWLYRTRVGAFEVHALQLSAAARPEMPLRDALNAWRDDLISGAGLSSSDLAKKYKTSVYRHHQEPDSGDLKGLHANLSVAVDDHHSPVDAPTYITLRVSPKISFYQARLPRFASKRCWLRLSLMLCTVGASLLARYELLHWVVLVTSLAAAITSWVEFADLSRKMERYTRVVSGLEQLLSWWDTLTYVEKASTESISHLVTSSEAIINEERMAWLSTAANKSAQSDHNGADRGKAADGEGTDKRKDNKGFSTRVKVSPDDYSS